MKTEMQILRFYLVEADMTNYKFYVSFFKINLLHDRTINAKTISCTISKRITYNYCMYLEINIPDMGLILQDRFTYRNLNGSKHALATQK